MNEKRMILRYLSTEKNFEIKENEESINKEQKSIDLQNLKEFESENLNELVSDEKVPKKIIVYSSISLIPIVIGTLASSTHALGLDLITSEFTSRLVYYQLLYCAPYLAFWGAQSWGMLMNQISTSNPLSNSLSLKKSNKLFIFGMIPCLLGTFSMALPPLSGLEVIAAGFTFLLWADISAVNSGFAPKWWLKLKFPITLFILISLTIPLVLSYNTPKKEKKTDPY